MSAGRVPEGYWFYAQVIYMDDGDSGKCVLDRGDHDYKGSPEDPIKLRFYNLDTWESSRRYRPNPVTGIRQKCSVEEVRRGLVAAWYAGWLLGGQIVRIRTHKGGKSRGVYGRYLAEVFFQKNGRWYDYAKHMIRKGFDRRESWYSLPDVPESDFSRKVPKIPGSLELAHAGGWAPY